MEKAIAGLAAGFAANGVTAIILCESDADRSIHSPEGYEIRSFRNDRKRKKLSLAPGLIAYAKTELGPDSPVILNAIFHPSVALFARLLRKLNVPYIVAPHDPYHDSIFVKNAKLKWPYWYLIERPMLRRAAAVQVLDRRHGELLRRRGVQTPVIEVINGHNPADVPPLDSLTFRCEGPPRLLYLGRMEELNKGLDLLIDAFNEVAESTDAVLTLQGPDSGDLASLKRRAQRLKHRNRIHFVPPDFGVSSASLAAQHDLFVLPSRFEGFSIAAMEAMLAARPVIISDIAGLAPHVTAAGAGQVIDATVPSVRDALLEMLHRRAEWKSMGLAGREYVLERFRWDRIARDAMTEFCGVVKS